GVEDVLAQLLQRGDEDAGAARLVDVGLEHLGGAGAEAAVDEALQSADLDPVVAVAGLDAEPGQLAPFGQRPAEVDAQGEPAGLGQLLVEAEELAARAEAAAVHVLDAGDAVAAGPRPGRPRRPPPLPPP